MFSIRFWFACLSLDFDTIAQRRKRKRSQGGEHVNNRGPNSCPDQEYDQAQAQDGLHSSRLTKHHLRYTNLETLAPYEFSSRVAMITTFISGNIVTD